MVLDGKSLQEYPVNAAVKAPFLVAHLLPCIDSLPDVICNTAIYTGDIYAACSKCEHASDLWQKLEFTCELEPDSRETTDWGRK